MKLLIFDFDGTLVDSLEIFIEATNCLAKKYGYSPIETSQIPQIRALSSRALIQQIPVARWRLPFFLQGLRQEVSKLATQIQLFDGAKEALTDLKNEGYCLGIVTSNAQSTVENFLVTQDLNTLFDFVHAGRGLLGKAGTLRRLVKRYRLQPSQVIYIGDETRDIEAAQQVQIPSIAVSWGFNSRVVLEQQQPDMIIDTPDDLLLAVQSCLVENASHFSHQ
ncbi:Phosphoglycolate phosphatase [Acaryochloris thomasi RCC1774]|uniref:Phosphoglycolate phosphatase n=1 Tax=Acaryochloris thomasi RCC1774 TaxID=1764569 RepID=A0A2W1JPL4_9CYAN|nr:HAD hydrolase-like protein [Acaryochloris thomasi]PZD75280.1 Phosphoglycolate phosphatase [Acaryochloris thomasi RCC1774]